MQMWKQAVLNARVVGGKAAAIVAAATFNCCCLSASSCSMRTGPTARLTPVVRTPGVLLLMASCCSALQQRSSSGRLLKLPASLSSRSCCSWPRQAGACARPCRVRLVRALQRSAWKKCSGRLRCEQQQGVFCQCGGIVSGKISQLWFAEMLGETI